MAKVAKFGIAHLAKKMKLKPSTVRIKLREAKIKKMGKSYTWATEVELTKVASKLAA
jgi:hypothetical protein